MFCPINRTPQQISKNQKNVSRCSFWDTVCQIWANFIGRLSRKSMLRTSGQTDGKPIAIVPPPSIPSEWWGSGQQYRSFTVPSKHLHSPVTLTVTDQLSQPTIKLLFAALWQEYEKETFTNWENFAFITWKLVKKANSAYSIVQFVELQLYSYFPPSSHRDFDNDSTKKQTKSIK